MMWTEANVQGLTRTTSSPVSLTWGGSPLPRLKSKKCSLTPPCGRVWTPHTGLWSRPHGEHPVLHATCLDCVPGSTLRVSGSSFCVASGASSLCVLQLAGVASHLIHVVTTGELALTQGFWVAESTNLQRGRRQGVSQRSCARPGSPSRAESRQPPTGSGRRRFASVPRGTACRGHHDGQHSAS